MQSISIKNEGLVSIDFSVDLNTQTYNHYFTRLKMLSTIMYKWEGLPEGIPERFIENNLFYYGKLAFFYDEELGYIITRCTQSSELNIYDEPIGYECFGNNGYNKFKKADEIVIIRNNFDELPTQMLVTLYCMRLTKLERIMDVNIDQQRTPLIIQCAEEQRQTLINLMMKYEGNEPFIFGNKALDISGINAIKTDSPFIADKLNDLKNKKWTECLDMLGINNANTQKRERLNTEEVNSNNQLLSFESDILLSSRQIACEEIFNKFNLKVSCELREESETEDNSDFEEGENNE